MEIFSIIVSFITLIMLLFLIGCGIAGIFDPRVYETLTKYFNPNYLCQLANNKYTLNANETLLVANMQHLYYLTLIPIAMLIVVLLCRRFSVKNILASHHMMIFLIVLSGIFSALYVTYGAFQVDELNAICESRKFQSVYLGKYEVVYFFILQAGINNICYTILVVTGFHFFDDSNDTYYVTGALLMIGLIPLLHPWTGYFVGKEFMALPYAYNIIIGLLLVAFTGVFIDVAASQHQSLFIPLDEELPYKSLIRQEKVKEDQEHGWYH